MAAFSGSHAGSVFSVKLIHISADERHANRMRQSFNCSVGGSFSFTNVWSSFARSRNRQCETLFSHECAISREASLSNRLLVPWNCPWQARVMQKRTVDSLLYSSIALLAFSILGFIYFLWQIYRMAAK